MRGTHDTLNNTLKGHTKRHTSNNGISFDVRHTKRHATIECRNSALSSCRRLQHYPENINRCFILSSAVSKCLFRLLYRMKYALCFDCYPTFSYSSCRRQETKLSKYRCTTLNSMQKIQNSDTKQILNIQILQDLCTCFPYYI